VAQEAAAKGGATIFGKKAMTIEEARQILGVDLNSSLEDVMVRYGKMFEANEKGGSFYLQSKVHRAKERIEAEFLGEGGAGEGGEGEGGEGGGGGAEGGGDGGAEGGGSNPNAGRGFAAGGVDPKDKQ
jgi:import inner membrane translocase subunit TIM16